MEPDGALQASFIQAFTPEAASSPFRPETDVSITSPKGKFHLAGSSLKPHRPHRSSMYQYLTT